MSTELSLTFEQRAELERCERVIQSGLETFELVGNALMSVRDARLYRETHGTFEEYCSEKWSLKERHAYRMMDAAKAVENLKGCPIGQVPKTESQARPLTKLETPEQQQEAWTAAVDASGGKPTAKHVEAAVEHVQARQSRPLTEYVPTPEVEARIEQAEKDSKTLYSLKSYWRQAGKKDRAAFSAWMKNN